MAGCGANNGKTPNGKCAKYINRMGLMVARTLDIRLDQRVRISRFFIVLAAAFAGTSVGRCQNREVPGRELLRFPIVLIAEPAALPGMFSGGFWNPAAAVLPDGTRWRVAAGAMSTPSDVSVNASAGAVTAMWRGSSLSLSVLRASVAGVVRTESDPLTIANDVQYSTIVTSLGIARSVRGNLAWGLAARVRSGQIDTDLRTSVALDGGVVLEHLTRLDARFGLSTLLASPWSGGREHATFIGGADLRLFRADSDRFVRAGVSATTTQGGESEQFAFASGRYGVWEVRGGPVRTSAFGAENFRTRMAIAVHYIGYSVGIAREGSPSGLGPSYQFVLSSLIR